MASLQGALKNTGTKPTVVAAQNQWLQQAASIPLRITSPAGATVATNAESDLAAAYVTPAHYNSGTTTNAAVRPNGQALTQATGYRHVAGHLVNNHLGGSGQIMANIATFSHQDNMDHKATEAPAKALVSGGSNIVYWTAIKERADYSVNGYTVTGAASKMVAGWFNETTQAKGTVNTYNIGPDGNTANWTGAPAVSKRRATGVKAPDESSWPSLKTSLLTLGALAAAGTAALLSNETARNYLMGGSAESE